VCKKAQQLIIRVCTMRSSMAKSRAVISVIMGL
jgi:hypothetical protein